jgi:hypothetical protein
MYLDSIYDLIVLLSLNNESYQLSSNSFPTLLKETIISNNLKRLISYTVDITYDTFIDTFFNKLNLVLSGSSILWCICGPKWGFSKNSTIKYENLFDNNDNNDNYFAYPDDFDFYINCDNDSCFNNDECINIQIIDLIGLLKSKNFYIDVSEYDFSTMEIYRSCSNIFVIINGLIKESNNSTYLLKYKPLLINFYNELNKIMTHQYIFTWDNCNQFFNILYSYRYILLKFESELHILGSYELFGQFPVLKLRQEKEILSKSINQSINESIIQDDSDTCDSLKRRNPAKIQIIFNTNHKIKFDNYDFDFLKSYIQFDKKSKNITILFNNSLKSIIKRNENNISKIYRDNSAFYYNNASQILCCLSSFPILYVMKDKYYRINQFIKTLAFYTARSIYRKMKYSSRGFNCLNIDINIFEKFNLSIIFEQYFNHQSKSMKLKGIKMLTTNILIYDKNVLKDNYKFPLHYCNLKLEL